MSSSNEVADKYFVDASIKFLKNGNGNVDANALRLANTTRKTFKDVYYVLRLGYLELPGVVQLPTGSCDAIFLRASRNNVFGYIPISVFFEFVFFEVRGSFVLGGCADFGNHSF